MLPRLGKVMGAENRVEDMGEEENRSLGKMLQYPVRDTVWARSLARHLTHFFYTSPSTPTYLPWTAHYLMPHSPIGSGQD